MKRRLSALDWIFVGVVGLILVMVFLLFWQNQPKDAETVNIEYTMRCLCEKGRIEERLGQLQGKPVRSQNGTAVLGKVTAAELLSHREPVVQNGEILFVDSPNLIELWVTVEGTGVALEGDGLRISDIRIAANGRGDFQVGNLYLSDVLIVHVKRS